MGLARRIGVETNYLTGVVQTQRLGSGAAGEIQPVEDAGVEQPAVVTPELSMKNPQTACELLMPVACAPPTAPGMVITSKMPPTWS